MLVPVMTTDNGERREKTLEKLQEEMATPGVKEFLEVVEKSETQSKKVEQYTNEQDQLTEQMVISNQS